MNVYPFSKYGPYVALVLIILGFIGMVYIGVSGEMDTPKPTLLSMGFALITILATIVGVITLFLIIPLVEIWTSKFQLPTKILWTIALGIGSILAVIYYYVVERKNVLK